MNAFVTLAEIERSLLHDRPRRRVIIPDILPAGPCLLYGPSGVGKTGLAIRTAVAVAAGLSWAGHPVLPGSVLYVAGEDLEGAKLRLLAAARELGQMPAHLPIAVMEAPAEGLINNGARLAVLSAAKALAKQTDLPVAAIIVDTLAASFGSKSQDDATAASEYMNNADRTARELECAFLSVHHTGKRETAGMRGSRVFFDRADAILQISEGKDGASFGLVEKMRNGPGGARFMFEIGGLEVETAGGVVSAQVIRELRPLERRMVSTAEVQAKRRQTVADSMLAILVRLGGMGEVGGAATSAWQTACYASWSDKSSAQRRKLFSNMKNRMVSDGLIAIIGDTVTVTVTGDTLVTPLMTHHPENVTVTVTNPPSPEGGDSDRRTGDSEEDLVLPSDNPAASASKLDTLGPIRKANAFRRGCGGETPATSSRAGDGDVGTADGKFGDAA